MNTWIKRAIILTSILTMIIAFSTTSNAESKNREKKVTDVTEVFGKSFNEAYKLLGMEERLLGEEISPREKRMSVAGDETGSYISNTVLPENEDVPNCFTVYICDKDYNVSGVTVGTTREEVDMLMLSEGWEDDGDPNNSFYHYYEMGWTATIVYSDDRVDYVLIQVAS